MPLYEYECDTCHHRFEVIRKFSDPPPESCPKCGSTVQKLPSSPAIQFKGSGFYITDYARAGKGEGGGASEKAEGSSSSSEGKNESKGESKTETKSEGKTDGKTERKSEAKTETKTETKSDSKPTPPASSS